MNNLNVIPALHARQLTLCVTYYIVRRSHSATEFVCGLRRTCACMIRTYVCNGAISDSDYTTPKYRLTVNSEMGMMWKEVVAVPSSRYSDILELP